MQPQQNKKLKSTHVSNWEEFHQRSMNILVENPAVAKFVMKYVVKNHRFLLKVTDGDRMVIKKCNADKQYDQVQKFAKVVAKILGNEDEEAQKKVQQQTMVEKEAAKKKKNKKKK